MLNLGIEPKMNYSTRDRVYELLKENIISLKLEPGRSISEKEISDMLHVSRTPVREAFVKLTQDGLLEIYPQRGTFVSLIDMKHVEEARFIREQLERAAVREACGQFSADGLHKLAANLDMQQHSAAENDYNRLFELDEQFHHTIVTGSGKELIWSVIQHMKVHINRVRVLSLAANYDWDLILQHHVNIYEAIKRRDEQAADHAMGQHLRKLTFEQDELKKQYQAYFKS